MATADLITSFLNNEMSPEQERGFLLTVASSDTLRLELKSHVMLDRLFVAQVERAEVPESVRGLIFAQAGVSIDGLRADDAPRSTGALEAGRRLSRSIMNRFVRGGLLLLVASTGFAAGYFSGNSDEAPTVAAPAASAPASTPQQVESAPKTTISPALSVEPTASTSMTTLRNESASPGRENLSAPRTRGRSAVERPTRRNPVSVDRPSEPVSSPAATTAPTSAEPAVVAPETADQKPSASVDVRVKTSEQKKKEKEQEESKMP